MCNNTSRDPVKVGGQPSNDASSDSEEFNSEKIADVPMDEQMNNSNNSNVSLSNLNSSPNHQLADQQQQIDSLMNGIADSFGSTNAGRLLQTMNLLLSSQFSSDSVDEPQQAPSGELIETIQRLLAQSGAQNQSIANSLLAAAASQQRTNSFACKFCAFTTSKRQQLIRHVRTNCEGLLAVMASGATPTTKSTTTTNSTNADCSSPTGEQPAANEELAASGQLLSPAVIAALNNDHLSSVGCGNLACVNSNCTNGNSCVLLPNAGSVLNDKLKSIGQPADDSEEDYANSANPQDR